MTLLIAVLLLLLFATPVSAEWYSELYAGVASTDLDDIEGDALGIRFTLSDLETDTSFAVGGRAGYWFNFVGVGLDVFYHRADTKDQDVTSTVLGVPTPVRLPSADVDVYGIGADVLLRIPALLESDEFPHGRVQPYIVGGPVLFITDFSGEDTDTSVGFKAGVGVAVLFNKNIGLFAEYRFAHHSPEVEINGVRLEGDVNTHFGLIGPATRF
ncbi:MAG TPA: outer membrane beta-barrel protein [Candidatus Tectomicrobia bacterium]|nr:outer membrane beta-barrel protein [Candidatus Tectomicrobia bacterium]